MFNHRIERSMSSASPNPTGSRRCRQVIFTGSIQRSNSTHRYSCQNEVVDVVRMMSDRDRMRSFRDQLSPLFSRSHIASDHKSKDKTIRDHSNSTLGLKGILHLAENYEGSNEKRLSKRNSDRRLTKTKCRPISEPGFSQQPTTISVQEDTCLNSEQQSSDLRFLRKFGAASTSGTESRLKRQNGIYRRRQFDQGTSFHEDLPYSLTRRNKAGRSASMSQADFVNNFNAMQHNGNELSGFESDCYDSDSRRNGAPQRTNTSLSSNSKYSTVSSCSRKSAEVNSQVSQPLNQHLFRVDFSALGSDPHHGFISEVDENQELHEQTTPPNDTTAKHEELILAMAGVTLQEAIAGILEKRGLGVDQVNLYIEKSNTPVPLITDTSCFGGLNLFVKAREGKKSGTKLSTPFGSISASSGKSTFGALVSSSQAGNPAIAIATGGKREGLSILPGTMGSNKHDRKMSLNVSLPKRNTRQSSTTNAEPLSNPATSIDMLASSSFDESGGGPSHTPSFADTTRRNRSQSRLPYLQSGSSKAKEKQDFISRLSQFAKATNPNLEENFVLPEIEEHWTRFVPNRELLTKREQDLQEGIWELVQTEKNHLEIMHNLLELDALISDLQQENYLIDIETKKVFCNIDAILKANMAFWNMSIQPLLCGADGPLDPAKLMPGFRQFDEIFYPYTMYCIHHKDLVNYIRFKEHQSDLFREFVFWVQSEKTLCGRLKLTDMLVCPAQRICKYSLLLKNISKSCDDPETVKELEIMIDYTESFCERVNVEMRCDEQRRALSYVMHTIDSYDAVDPGTEEQSFLIRPYTKLDLLSPMLGCHPKVIRSIILQGDLKYRDKENKMEVKCFLFTDMFLVCKVTPKKSQSSQLPRVRIVKPPYHIDKLLVQDMRESNSFMVCYINEFSVVESCFTMLAVNSNECTKWLEHFKIAKSAYRHHREEPTNYTTLPFGNAYDLLPHTTPSPHIVVNSGLHSTGQTLMAQRMPTVDALTVPSHQTGSEPDVSSTDIKSTADRLGPTRRISIGALESNRRKLQVEITHGRSSSMDSTVQQAMLKTNSKSLASQASDAVPSAPSSFDSNGYNEVEPSLAKTRVNASVPELSVLADDEENNSPKLPPAAISPRGVNEGVITQRQESSDSSLNVQRDDIRYSAIERSIDSSKETINFLDGYSRVDSHSSSETIRDPLESFRPLSEDTVSDKDTPITTATTTGPLLDEVPIIASSKLLNNSALSKITQPQNPNSPPKSHTRRFEKRYHTADGIEDLKPKKNDSLGAIHKRFSWNISLGRSQKPQTPTISEIRPTVEENCEGFNTPLSQSVGTNCTSWDSFCSSSGVSSSSSHLCISENDVTHLATHTGDATNPRLEITNHDEDVSTLGNRSHRGSLNRIKALEFDEGPFEDNEESDLPDHLPEGDDTSMEDARTLLSVSRQSGSDLMTPTCDNDHISTITIDHHDDRITPEITISRDGNNDVSSMSDDMTSYRHHDTTRPVMSNEKLTHQKLIQILMDKQLEASEV